MDVTAPTTSKCGVTATSSMATAPATGADATVTVDTTRDCTWSASSDASWMTLGAAAAGQGSGSIDVRISANQTPVARQGVVLVNDNQVTISQAGAPCTFSATPATAAVGAAGGAMTVQVGTLVGCAWTASSAQTWLTVSSGTNGPGQATITAALNTGAARSGAVTIAGQTITVAQAGAAAACTVTLSPASQSMGAAGGATAVSVTAGAGCSWIAQPNAPWITVTGGQAGSGPGTVALSAAANSGAARAGSVTIGDQVFNLSQEAASAPPPPCTYMIAPTSQAVGSPGGSVPVTVTAGNGCSWTAAANASWLTIASGASGSGAGVVTISVAADTGAARMGTATIAGNTFTVNQAAAAPCDYTISPTHATFSASAGSGTVAVTTAAGCTWTATTHDSWISITDGSSGAGSGTVTYDVSANGKKDRTADMTIAGQTFAVTQSGTK